MLALQIYKPLNRLLPLGFCLVYLFILILLMQNYFLWNSNVFIGLALAPYICSVENGKRSLRYLIPALLMSGIALMMAVKTTLFLAMIFAVLLLAENLWGKINSVLLFLLLLISPLFAYASSLFGFPIRLWLSEVAARIIGFLGIKASASGNMITLDNYEFSVDQACAGLNMLATSLIICLFIISFYQRKLGKQLSFLQIVLLLTGTIGLNIVCNLFRIILLVLFKVMPGNFMHDGIGVICLLGYVIIPLLLFTKLFTKRYVKTKTNEESRFNLISHLRYPLLHFLFLMMMISITLNLKPMDKVSQSYNPIRLNGFKKEILENGIIKFENKEALIYMKSTAFYASEHNPMVCWKGSGYDFKFIKKQIIKGKEIYTGTLIKGKDKIYSAWWFDNGTIKTINQLNWRWHAAKGEKKFYLVNVNAANPSHLKSITEWMIARK